MVEISIKQLLSRHRKYRYIYRYIQIYMSHRVWDEFGGQFGGGYWQGIFLKLWPPEFLCMDNLSFKFGAEIPKNVDFFLMANFWWSILAGSKIHAISAFTTCSLSDIGSFKALPLAAHFQSLLQRVEWFLLDMEQEWRNSHFINCH